MTIKKYLETIPSFAEKTIIVTGGTAGIGLELCKHLLKKNAHVVIMARNLNKADSIKQNLIRDYPNGKVDIIHYDQSDYQLIDEAINQIKEKYPNFYALVANAGILYPSKDAISKQGNPLTIETNFLGLKRLLDQLIPLYKNKRYVMHGSLVAGANYKNIDILNPNYSLFKQYNISKCCVEALWHHYYVNNKDNEFILTEPGIAGSDIIRNFHQPIRSMGKFVMTVFSHSPKKASLCMLKALTNDSKNGDYIVPRGPWTMSGFPKYKKFPNKRKREYLIRDY